MSRKSLACLVLGLVLIFTVSIASSLLTPRQQGLRNQAPSAEDRTLEQKLTRELNGERNAQDNLYDYSTVSVRDRVATVSGYAHTYSARNEAIDTARSAKGVEDVVDNIEVLPVSTFDDRIRAEAARRIFSGDGMGKYWLNPFHPIRIIVRNGNLILEGKVVSDIDRVLAQTAANNVPGAFTVTNNLEVDPKLTNFEGH
jgi:hyperosmotically inducible periplasmic protein